MQHPIYLPLPLSPLLCRKLLGATPGPQVTAARITPDGSLYLRPQSTLDGPAAAAAATSGLHSGFRPPSKATSRAARPTSARKLLLIGADNRREVPMAQEHSYPFSTVGYIDSDCTGTLVARSTVLTAGHCVFDRRNQQWKANLDYWPNMAAGGPHCHKSGGCTRDTAVAWAHVDTLFVHASTDDLCPDGSHGCSSAQDSVFDIALIRLAEPVGDTYGWMASGYRCAATSYAVTTAGYADDLPDRHMYTTSGTLYSFSACPAPQWSVSGNVVRSDLDAATGQSGSAVWDSQQTVRGIIVTISDRSTNVRAISKEAFDWMKGVMA